MRKCFTKRGLESRVREAYAGIIGENVEAGVDTYINVNNHYYEGNAPLAAVVMAEIRKTWMAPVAQALEELACGQKDLAAGDD